VDCPDKRKRGVAFMDNDGGENAIEEFTIVEKEDLLRVASNNSTGTIIDSGAGDHVEGGSKEPGDKLTNLRATKKRYSLADVGTPGAKTHTSEWSGDKLFMSDDGTRGFKMTGVSHVATLSRDIFSVSRACDRGKVVIFTRDDAIIVKEGAVKNS
jgi:hypothetical protein